ncbi:WASH complex subunit 5-like, partial [Centruroides sculpturatus]|uniref:WASH complex subunit 5-like n=1 Tax=Centruroides sculpturatus TaxID=218467 RepID=UPI000C6EFF1F
VTIIFHIFCKYYIILFSLVDQPSRIYSQVITRAAKVWATFLDNILKIGQMQLLRKLIAHELNTSGKFDSKNLISALQTMNDSLLADIEAHYKDPSKPYPNDNNPLMYELSNYLEWTGISNPLAKIYITTGPLPHIPLFLFLFTIFHLSKLNYVKNIDGLISKKTIEPIDGIPFVIGTLTLLRQFHQEKTGQFLAYLGQYIRSNVESVIGEGSKGGDFPQEVLNILVYLDEFQQQGKLPRKAVTKYIPDYLFDKFHVQ